MFSTAVAIVGAIALLSPGFVVVELSEARGARAQHSDLALALRAVFYAVLIHLAFGWWTAHLAANVGDVANWRHHVGAISLYVITVLVAVPIALGYLINTVVKRAESGFGPPGVFAAGLGAGEARDAFDFAFQHARNEGAWLIIELVGHTPADPRLVGGRYGKKSAIGQTPSDHDIYLETLYLVTEKAPGQRELAQESDPPIGMYVPAEQIARVDILPTLEDPPATQKSRRQPRLQWPLRWVHEQRPSDRGGTERAEDTERPAPADELQAGRATALEHDPGTEA